MILTRFFASTGLTLDDWFNNTRILIASINYSDTCTLSNVVTIRLLTSEEKDANNSRKLVRKRCAVAITATQTPFGGTITLVVSMDAARERKRVQCASQCAPSPSPSPTHSLTHTHTHSLSLSFAIPSPSFSPPFSLTSYKSAFVPLTFDSKETNGDVFQGSALVVRE